MIRLFIAFPLAVEVKDYLGTVMNDLRPQLSGVKWVAPKNIHLTVRFLGDTMETRVTSLCQLIDSVAKAHPVVPSKLSDLGAFPNLKRPRVIWAGIGQGIPELTKIANEVELKVRQMHYDQEPKGFKTHLTLGRVREGARFDRFDEIITMNPLKPLPFTFDQLVLYKSTLTPNGPIYERLHSAELRA